MHPLRRVTQLLCLTKCPGITVMTPVSSLQSSFHKTMHHDLLKTPWQVIPSHAKCLVFQCWILTHGKIAKLVKPVYYIGECWMKCLESKGTEMLQGKSWLEVEREERVDLELGLRLKLHLSPLCLLDFDGSSCLFTWYTWEGSLSEAEVRLACGPTCEGFS